MTRAQLEKIAELIGPDASLNWDEWGEITIHTGLKDADGVDFDQKDEPLAKFDIKEVPGY